MRQSSSPTEASESRPSAGGVSFACATIIADARSGPNQGLARAPFTGFRVVATMSVGLADSSEASKRAPLKTDRTGASAEYDRGGPQRQPTQHHSARYR